MIQPTIVDITESDITLESIYSFIFMGAMKSEFRTLSLFSKSTMAPMKKSPKAEGSENTTRAEVIPLQVVGNAYMKPI